MQTELFYKIIDKVIIVKFKGEVNYINKDDFERVINRDINGFETVIVDFTKVTYISSSSISFIISLKTRYSFNMIAIVPYSCFVNGIFALMQLDRFIKRYSNLTEALNGLGVEYEKS